MSLFSKDSLIPLASLLAGTVLASAFFVWRQQPSPGVQAAIAQFNELPESQQTNVQNIAAEYLKDPAYQQRIQAIHVAVEQDPTLLDKLHEVDSLLKSQDPPTRARLQSSDVDWLQGVEQLHRRQTTAVSMVKLFRVTSSGGKGESVDLIAEKDVGEFLDEIIGESEGLTGKLAELDPERHRDERILTKVIWLVKKMQPGVNGNVVCAKVVHAARQYMADSGIIQKVEEQAKRWRSESRDDQAFLNRMISGMLIRTLLKHYVDRFNQIHVPANSDAVEVFDGEIDRRRQVELMQMDPAVARSQLYSEIIRHVKDPAIEALNQDLKELDSQILRTSDMGRGRGGGGRSGYPNRPPNRPQGGRKGDDRDNRSPQRDRPPGDDRERPPGPRN